MDISETTAAKSDQQNYDDYLGGNTRTVTIAAVTKGSDEQPVKIELAEFPGRPYKPNLSMRRVLLVSWGADASAYVGRRMKLFGNPNVVWAGKAVGGIEIEALSHIDKPITMALTQTRGKRRNFTVKPLPDAAPQRDWLTELDLANGDLRAISALGSAATAANAGSAIIDKIRAAYAAAKDATSD